MFKAIALSAVLSSSFLATPSFAGCADNSSEFLAAVVFVDGNTEVWINTRANWVMKKSLVDYYTDREQKLVDKITANTRLCNLAESLFEPCMGGRSAKQIKAELQKSCVQVDSDFQRWAEKEVLR